MRACSALVAQVIRWGDRRALDRRKCGLAAHIRDLPATGVLVCEAADLAFEPGCFEVRPTASCATARDSPPRQPTTPKGSSFYHPSHALEYVQQSWRFMTKCAISARSTQYSPGCGQFRLSPAARTDSDFRQRNRARAKVDSHGLPGRSQDHRALALFYFVGRRRRLSAVLLARSLPTLKTSLRGNCTIPNEYQQEDSASGAGDELPAESAIGWVLEWGIARPWHYVATQTFLAPVLNGGQDEDSWDRCRFRVDDAVPVGSRPPELPLDLPASRLSASRIRERIPVRRR